VFELILLLFERELTDEIGSPPNCLILDGRKGEVLAAYYILAKTNLRKKLHHENIIRISAPLVLQKNHLQRIHIPCCDYSRGSVRQT
jgi:hypothetical protein